MFQWHALIGEKLQRDFPSMPMSILNLNLLSVISPAVFQTLQGLRSQENVPNRLASGHASLIVQLMVTVRVTRNAVETAPECAQLLSDINPGVTKCQSDHETVMQFF